MKCPKCGNEKLVKNGKRANGDQIYGCRECHTYFDESIGTSAKVLLVDIETAPIQALVWRVWKENINIDQIQNDWFMLCWSAKWLNDSNIIGERLTSKEAKAKNDRRITTILWELFDEADIIIAHNGDKFDIPKINSRFLLHKLPPPRPYRTIDTLRIAQKKFGFSHNKLDYLAQQFGLDRKLKTEFSLWVECLEGKEDALEYMLKYNKKDILVLEEVYYKLRGWMDSHPNVNMFQPKLGCSHCGSSNIQKNGFYTTQLNRYRSWQCLDCGAFSRETRKSLISTAR